MRCLLKHKTVEGLSKIWVEKVNLRKRFKYCDTVAITGGEAMGVTGVIIAVIKDCCTIAGLQANQMANEYTVHINNCKVVKPQDGNAIPWLGEHVTIAHGSYKEYTGIITDMEPPTSTRPFTELEINVLQLGQVLRFKHDNVFQTCSNLLMQYAIPLRLNQQHFKQQEWSLGQADTEENVHGHNTSERQTAVQVGNSWIAADQGSTVQLKPTRSMHTLKVPWDKVQVRVVRGPCKYISTVVDVNRFRDLRSGLCVMAKFDQIMLGEQGVGHEDKIGYETGLALHLAHPLWYSQRYYKPLNWSEWKALPAMVKPSHTSWDPSSSAPELTAAQWEEYMRLTNMILDLQNWKHWTMDERLHGQTFLAQYCPPNGHGSDCVYATPDVPGGVVIVEWGKNPSKRVPPAHVWELDPNHCDAILPTH
ncbi:hypothetical protein D9758_017066 [Tetrapyrgos nigripes]|uniref:Uncharacterized protein n=1 Tax=Tetrapyrgos nigripes TaxID=182062 RepID=A0A8H5FLK7_9AGAR|nr:hypothetical protein D9758_017066 [Tetrapyrgos nigripes]